MNRRIDISPGHLTDARAVLAAAAHEMDRRNAVLAQSGARRWPTGDALIIVVSSADRMFADDPCQRLAARIATLGRAARVIVEAHQGDVPASPCPADLPPAFAEAILAMAGAPELQAAAGGGSEEARR